MTCFCILAKEEVCLYDSLLSLETMFEIFWPKYGYTSNPERLISPLPIDSFSESEGLAYLDANADAVRKGDEVPDRPIRITVHVILDGVYSRWKLKSVEELRPGVKAKPSTGNRRLQRFPHGPTSSSKRV